MVSNAFVKYLYKFMEKKNYLYKLSVIVEDVIDMFIIRNKKIDGILKLSTNNIKLDPCEK